MTHSTVKQQKQATDSLTKLQKKWQTLIESTDFTHSSRKGWKTINKLSNDYAQPQQQCKVTADHVGHQLLPNGKGNLNTPAIKG